MLAAAESAAAARAKDPRWNPNAVGCPHPQSRTRAAIQVSNEQGETMELCMGCKQMFDRILARWAAADIAPVEIRAQMRRRGYDAADADRFITDLEAAA